MSKRSHKSVHLASSKINESFKRLIGCPYCPEMLESRGQEERHRRQCHAGLDFRCGQCPAARPDAAGVAEHARLAHSHGQFNVVKLAEMRPPAILLPEDLRSLQCRLCGLVMLAQDRVDMRSHVKHSHGIHVALRAIRYECRLCSQDFCDTVSFLSHPCCKLNRQNKILPQPLFPEWAQVLTPSSSLSPSEGLVAVEKKLLHACLYCPERVERSKMPSHMALFHRQLEFTCGFCQKTSDFVEGMVTHLGETHPHEPVKTESPTNEDKVSTEIITLSIAIDAFEEFLPMATDHKFFLPPKDLRLLECPMCDEQSRKMFLAQPRHVLRTHLREDHGQMDFESVDTDYKCRLCGARDIALSHRCFTTSTAATSVPNRVESIKDPPAAWPSPNDNDQRRLECLLCGHRQSGGDFFQMVQHLESAHNHSQDDDLERLVSFSCWSCAVNSSSGHKSFSGLHEWDAHFKPGYQTCSMAPSSTTDASSLSDS